MNIKPIHKNHVLVDAIAFDDWNNRQNTIFVMEKERKSELMLGFVLKSAPDLPEVKEGETVLFQAFNRDLGVFAFPIDEQKLMEPGKYVIFTHAILATLESESQDAVISA